MSVFLLLFYLTFCLLVADRIVRGIVQAYYTTFLYISHHTSLFGVMAGIELSACYVPPLFTVRVA